MDLSFLKGFKGSVTDKEIFKIPPYLWCNTIKNARTTTKKVVI